MSLLWSELVFLILQFLGEEKFKETVHRYEILYFVYFVNFFCGVLILLFFFNLYAWRLEQEGLRKWMIIDIRWRFSLRFGSKSTLKLWPKVVKNFWPCRRASTSAALSTSLAGWMANPSVVSRLSASAGPIYLVARNNAGRLHQTSEPAAFDSFLMFLQPLINIPGIYSKTSYLISEVSCVLICLYFLFADLPLFLVCIFTAAAILKRRGGHPTKNTAIDYQTADSEHVSKRPRPFGPSDEAWTEIWPSLLLSYPEFLPLNIMPISYSSQSHGQSSYSSDDLPKNPVMALNQGSAVKSMDFHPVQKIPFLFPGVAYSRHIVHVYSYHGGADIRNHLEFIFSTATDGKIKAWLYDNAGSRVDYDAPGRSSTTMAYSADGTRVFLCGTNKEGESHLVEWNESEGAVKRNCNGLAKRTAGDVKFDTTNNRFLAAGDEFKIKFWDMDNSDLLTTIDAEGGLPASPCIRFNKEGSLLVVSSKDNGIKILANSDGIRLLRTVESRAFDDPGAAACSQSGVMHRKPSVIPYGVKLNDANHSLQSQLVEIFVAGVGKFNNLLSRAYHD
ncbi:hypothetical protein DKX38_028570 [Salix brachista]|uniref:Uncharacterized protein n=1 Tax=Salix brachista TaxID=2182728 RepID=A0A5N5J9K5_9ROSI|nr:hypothetical protein DKX38_028570 [Salix brachista]